VPSEITSTQAALATLSQFTFCFGVWSLDFVVCNWIQDILRKINTDFFLQIICTLLLSTLTLLLQICYTRHFQRMFCCCLQVFFNYETWYWNLLIWNIRPCQMWVLEFLKPKGTLNNKTFSESRDKGNRGWYCCLSKPNYCREGKRRSLALITWVDSVVFGLTLRRHYVGPVINLSFHRGICHVQLLTVW